MIIKIVQKIPNDAAMQFTPSEKLKALYRAKIENMVKKV